MSRLDGVVVLLHFCTLAVHVVPHAPFTDPSLQILLQGILSCCDKLIPHGSGNDDAPTGAGSKYLLQKTGSVPFRPTSLAFCGGVQQDQAVRSFTLEIFLSRHPPGNIRQDLHI